MIDGHNLKSGDVFYVFSPEERSQAENIYEIIEVTDKIVFQVYWFRRKTKGKIETRSKDYFHNTPLYPAHDDLVILKAEIL